MLYALCAMLFFSDHLLEIHVQVSHDHHSGIPATTTDCTSRMESVT